MLDQNVPNPLAKNPNFHTHKVFASVGIILILMVIICGGIWYFVQSAEDKNPPDGAGLTYIKPSNSSAKTARSSEIPSDWTTETSSKYGFSINYPKSWAFGESQASNNSYGESYAYLSEMGGIGGINIDFLFFGGSKIMDEYNSAKALNMNETNTATNTTRLADTEIASFKTIKTRFVYGPNEIDEVSRFDYFIQKDNKIFEIQAHYATQPDIEQIDKVLSTFKFL